MNILYICHRIPYPPNKGEKIRSYNILKHLCSRHEVHLAFLVDDKRDVEHIEALRPMVKSLHYDIINPKLKKLQSSLALFGSKPISVPYFYSPSLQKSIDSVLDNQNIDCVFCYSSPTAEYAFRSRVLQEGSRKTASLGRWEKQPNNTTKSVASPSPLPIAPCPSPIAHRPLLIMDFVDLDSHKWRQYADASGLPMKWVYAREAKYLLRYELKIASDFDHCFFVSEAEKDLLLKQAPFQNICAISNGVDYDFFNPNHESPLKREGPVLVFTGMMDYFPNVEGITWFAKEILPKIQTRFPKLTLYIVGNRPSPEVKRLAQIKNVVVTGFVEDVRDYIALADICIVPLRIARGVQNKVLEAMAMEKPVVTTSAAAQGITAENEKHLWIADTASEFISAVENLLNDEDKRRKLAEGARQVILQNYSWGKNLEKLETLIAA